MAIPNTTHRILVERLGGTDPSEFVGNEGEVFYDPDSGSPTLRLSDGSTAGGIVVGGSGGSSGISSLFEDTSPSLGGNLDTNSQVITGTNVTLYPQTNGDIFLTLDGNGDIFFQPDGGKIYAQGVTEFGTSQVIVGGATTALVVAGDTRITGILTIGTSSITLDGITNSINVGSGVTIDGSTGSISVSSLSIGGTSISINSLVDVDTSTVSPTTGDILTWDGSSWVPNNPNTQSLPAGILILAHLDGANGSTYTVEDGPYSRNVATINGATISTANSKFGGASLALNGSLYQGIAISSPEAFGTGDFSVDLWVYYDGIQQNSFPAILNLSEDLEWGVNASNGGVYAQLYDRSSNFVGESWTGAGAINNNLWNHLALQYASGTFQIWVNGNPANTVTGGLDYTGSMVFGTYSNQAGGLNGYIDEIRVTNTVVYTFGSTFTPPSSPYS